MKIMRVGIDLAKNVLQVHGVDEQEKMILRKQLRRKQMLAFFAQLPPCLIGMESCGGSHYWARELKKLGHDARLIALQFVKPYRRNDKNDRNDAEAICEAVGRPNMRFVPTKDEEQQAVLTLHRARALLVSDRTALVNQTRGLLTEYGIVVAQGVARLRAALPGILEDGDNALPPLAREVFADLYERLRVLDAHITEYDRRILRTLLVHGARAVMRHLARCNDARSRWVLALKERRGLNKAAVALAAKQARILWSLLARDRDYQPLAG